MKFSHLIRGPNNVIKFTPKAGAVSSKNKTIQTKLYQWQY